MATLALRPAFPVRPRSTSKREPRQRLGPRTHDRSWRIAGIAAAIALALFTISAPMMGDKAGRLYALEGAPTASADANAVHPWGAEFELTPAMMGPAIDVDAMTSIDEDAAVVTMPELNVTALPIVSTTEDASAG